MVVIPVACSGRQFRDTGNPEAMDSRAARQSRTDQRPSVPLQKTGLWLRIACTTDSISSAKSRCTA